jgi:hypothetical protein
VTDDDRKQVEAEFAEHGSVAIHRLAPGEATPRLPFGKDYHPKSGDSVWVRSRDGTQWPVILRKDHRGMPIFKFGSKIIPVIFDVKRTVWVIKELLG